MLIPRVAGEQSKRFEMRRNPLMYMDFLYNIANIDCAVERSGNDRGLPRLEPALRDKMLAMSGVDPKALRKRRPSVRRTGEDPTFRVRSTESERVRKHTVHCTW